MLSMRGSRVLIVEDEYLLAADLARYFRSIGATVVGPAASLEAAKRQMCMADAAVLDVDLNGEKVFAVADELARRGVPFVFFTGHDDIVIPARFRHAGQLSKPVRWEEVLSALFPDAGSEGKPADVSTDDVVSVLPKLRLSARLIMGDAAAADRLVELTLEQAIATIRSRPAHLGTEAWLSGLLEDAYRRHGADLLN